METFAPYLKGLSRFLAMLGVLLGFVALTATHTGRHASAAPVLIIAGAGFYLWASVSVMSGVCHIRGCPQGGYTPEDNPVNFYAAVCALYAVGAMYLIFSLYM